MRDVEPWGQTHQSELYAYAGNDPINNVDPSGLLTEQFLKGSSAGFQNSLLGTKGLSSQLQDSSSIASHAGALLGSEAGAFVGMAPSLFGAKALTGGAGSAVATGLGDLTAGEVNAIQGVVEDAGRPLAVPGSAASAARRGVGTDLPIGKGPGTQSDIDYMATPGSYPYFNG